MEFHEGQREIQDRFDTRRLADKLASVAGDSFGEEVARFIEARDMCFVATTDAEGFPDCSYKGGAPGFVRVVDEHTLELPVYDGNGMFRTLGNLTVNPRVGLLFVDWDTGTRLRVNGEATLVWDRPADAPPGAIGVVRIRANAVFPNCRRYVHRMATIEVSPFVPEDGAAPPVPDWKRDPWFEGTLPADDPALDPARPTAPSIPQF